MRVFVPCLVLILGLGAFPSRAPAADGPMRLFNGRDLSGWRAVLVKPAVKMEDVWSVRDGVLVCKGEPLCYLHTEKAFTNYRLVV